MPLSEHEQKLLDQMERALYAEDPGFATQMKGAASRASRGHLALGVLAVIVGLVVVLLGVNLASIPVGVVGFLVMLGGVVWALSPTRGKRQEGSATGGPAKSSKPGKGAKRSRNRQNSGSFMQRMEQRWEKRRHQGL